MWVWWQSKIVYDKYKYTERDREIHSDGIRVVRGDCASFHNSDSSTKFAPVRPGNTCSWVYSNEDCIIFDLIIRFYHYMRLWKSYRLLSCLLSEWSLSCLFPFMCLCFSLLCVFVFVSVFVLLCLSLIQNGWFSPHSLRPSTGSFLCILQLLQLLVPWWCDSWSRFV